MCRVEVDWIAAVDVGCREYLVGEIDLGKGGVGKCNILSLTLSADIDHGPFQTPNLAHYSSYPESAIIPTANIMLNYILKPIRHSSFFKKYASKKYMKVCYFAGLSYIDIYSLIPVGRLGQHVHS